MKKKVSMMLATVLVLGLLAVPALAAEVPGSDGRLTASNESIGTTIYVSRDLDVNTIEHTVYVYPVGTTFSWEDREETSEQFYMAPGSLVTMDDFYQPTSEEAGEVFVFERYNPDTSELILTYVMVGEVPEEPAPAGPATGTFTDVPDAAYYAQPVEWAVEQGITTGTGDGTTFSPDIYCTRGEIITFIWRASGSPAPTGPIPYVDVGPDNFYTDATVWAYEQGMANEGFFDPDYSCTRAMAVEFLWKQAGSPETAVTTQFTDVAPDASYAQAVAWAVEQGITTGSTDTEFAPDEACTRGQIATFLWRALAE